MPRAVSSATVIVPTVGRPRELEALLGSLERQTVEHQLIVVDNGSPDGSVGRLCARVAAVEVIRLERNAGFSRAVNISAERADGDAIVVLNDDCTCDPGFVGEIVGALDPAQDVVMAAGVMRDRDDPALIDTAGMELDSTLLAYNYLSGEPVVRLDGGVPDPIGPSGAAAAFDREAFLGVGGFDERLFAYWEDVDLVLRLRREGGRCALAPRARGTHEHSGTLGSGSAGKNYLMGFGRGYLLRKWGVVTPRRLGSVLAREAVLCLGQLIVDRNLAGVRGRIRGYLATRRNESYPAELIREGLSTSVLGAFRRRAALGARLRRRREAVR
jgi:N-acetylglucosaminyl-diphospho-decaprenol L-rhamnosyltransferase